MKVTLVVTLDESWNEYKDTDKELFVEDLYPCSKRTDGIEYIQIVSVEE